MERGLQLAIRADLDISRPDVNSLEIDDSWGGDFSLHLNGLVVKEEWEEVVHRVPALTRWVAFVELPPRIAVQTIRAGSKSSADFPSFTIKAAKPRDIIPALEGIPALGRLGGSIRYSWDSEGSVWRRQGTLLAAVEAASGSPGATVLQTSGMEQKPNSNGSVRELQGRVQS